MFKMRALLGLLAGLAIGFCQTVSVHAAPVRVSAAPAISVSFFPKQIAFITPGRQSVSLQNLRLVGAATTTARKSSHLATPRMLTALNSIPQSGACASGAYPAPILALASALKCDPDLIFEYVYNNIEVEPLYGSNKGALGTLLDLRGDDADQAILLVTLWNAAGYSQTGYANVPHTEVPVATVANWLGVANDLGAIENIMAGGGIPHQLNADGTLTFNHFVGIIFLRGSYLSFDPSFKAHTILPLSSGLASTLNYNRAQFLSDTGGTFNATSISSVNRAHLRADLSNYAANLIAQSSHTSTVGSVIGGKQIVPLVGSPLNQTYMGSFTGTFPVNCPNQSPTNIECRTSVSITMPGALSSQAIKLYTDQIYGHRITIFSVLQTDGKYVPTLLIDGAVPGCVGSGCTNVGPEAASGAAWNVPTTITQPNQPTAPTVPTGSCPTGVTASACKSLAITAGGSYLVSTGVGLVARGMAEYHRQLLAQARAAGNADSSEPVLGENLAVIGYSWLAESSAEQQIMGQIVQSTTLYNYALGIVGQSTIRGTSSQGPYVDLPLNQYHTTPLISGGPTTTVGGFSYPTADVSTFIGLWQASSSFESAVLQQTQAPVPGMVAASTVEIVDANMNASSLNTTFFADGTTSAGQSAFSSTIAPAAQSHYSTADWTTISGDVLNTLT